MRDFIFLQTPAPCAQIQKIFDNHHQVCSRKCLFHRITMLYQIARVVCCTLDNIIDVERRIFMLSHLIDIAHHCVLLLNLQ